MQQIVTVQEILREIVAVSLDVFLGIQQPQIATVLVQLIIMEGVSLDLGLMEQPQIATALVQLVIMEGVSLDMGLMEQPQIATALVL